MNITKNPIASLVLGAVLVASLGFATGFQSGQDKIGTVDLDKVLTDSNLGKQTQDSLNKRHDAYLNLLNYYKVNDVMTKAQANEIRTVTLQLIDKPDDPTAKSRLEAVQAAIAADQKSFTSLMEKKEPTPDDRNKLTDLMARRNDMRDFSQQVQQDLEQDLQATNQTKFKTLLDTANGAVKDAAAKKGFTIVIQKRAIVYSANEKANDLTEDAIGLMNK